MAPTKRKKELAWQKKMTTYLRPEYDEFRSVLVQMSPESTLSDLHAVLNQWDGEMFSLINKLGGPGARSAILKYIETCPDAGKKEIQALRILEKTFLHLYEARHSIKLALGTNSDLLSNDELIQTIWS